MLNQTDHTDSSAGLKVMVCYIIHQSFAGDSLKEGERKREA